MLLFLRYKSISDFLACVFTYVIKQPLNRVDSPLNDKEPGVTAGLILFTAIIELYGCYFRLSVFILGLVEMSSCMNCGCRTGEIMRGAELLSIFLSVNMIAIL